MCGIAGYISRERSLQGRLHDALAALEHRGPDDSGAAFFPSGGVEVGIGSTRLAIIDLSAAGHMPMNTADGACCIVFNGEIYDAAVHRRLLEARGVAFRSRSDTEVLLYGLTLDGPAFLDRVDGMYAFAFWDSRKPAGLLLARDRFGEKPLYLTERDGSLFFASELPPLLKLLGSKPDVDSAALQHILQWGYPPTCTSIFRHVRKLAPGAWEWFGSRTGAGTLAPLGPEGGMESFRDVRSAAALIKTQLHDSIRDRLIADVPTGIFLSGGLDSAGVAAIAASFLPRGKQLNTYTVGYPGSKFSEIQPARRFSEWLGTHHQEVILNHDSLSALPWVAGSLGEPIGDPAALPTYFLSVAARRTSTVLLTGEGADEIFYGYPRYLWHDIVGGSPHGSIATRAVAFTAGRVLRRVRNAPSSPIDRDVGWKSLGWPLGDLLTPGPDQSGTDPLTAKAGSAASWSRADDLARWMPESVLSRVDRMTMAASIESRAPYLAREVARLGMHLPEALLRRFPFGKVALRAALKEYFPFLKQWAVKRPFAVPLIEWLTGPLRPIFDTVFFGQRLLDRGWFQRDGLRTLGHAVLVGDRAAARMAWSVVTLELWARAYLDGEVSPKPDPERFATATTCSNRGRRKHLVLAMDFPPDIGGIQLYNKQIWGCGGYGDIKVLAGRKAHDEAFDRMFPGQVVRLRQASGSLGRLDYLLGVTTRIPAHLSRDSVIHVAHVALAPAVFPYAAVLQNPVVAWTHALELTNPRLAIPIRWLLNRADRVVVVSDYTAHLALERGAHPDRIVKISPGGDDLKVLYPNPRPTEFRAEFGVGDGEFLILSVGRASPFNRYKGFDRAIQIAKVLVEHRRAFRWIVIGGGPDVPIYGAQVAAEHLQSRMAFVGSVDDQTLANAYSACDLFCLFSREETTPRGILAEGFGIVYVQAGSFGKPVMGLRRGGVPDAVLDGRTGVLLDEDCAEAIARRIEALMDSVAERERLGGNGLKNASGSASWSAARQKVNEMLSRL